MSGMAWLSIGCLVLSFLGYSGLWGLSWYIGPIPSWKPVPRRIYWASLGLLAMLAAGGVGMLVIVAVAIFRAIWLWL